MRRYAAISPRAWNRIARWAITAGGASIVLAVLAILVFIAREAAPLAGRARSAVVPAFGAPGTTVLAAGVDDQKALAFFVTPREIVFVNTRNDSVIQRVSHAFTDSAEATCARYETSRRLVALGTGNGQAALVQVDFTTRWEGAQRTTEPRVRWRGAVHFDSLGAAVRKVAGDRGEEGEVALAAILADGTVRYALLDADGVPAAQLDLAPEMNGTTPRSLAITLEGEYLAVGSREGALYLWNLAPPATPGTGEAVRASTGAVTALETLLGDQVLVVGSDAGEVSVWQRVRYLRARNEGTAGVDFEGTELAPGEERVVRDRGFGTRYARFPNLKLETDGFPWERIRDMESHTQPVLQIASSPRTRTFATADGSGMIRLHHSTSERTLLDLEPLGAPLQSISFSPKSDGLVALDGGGRMHAWEIDAPHAEASLRSLFGRVWYEGYVQPEHVWQSTGGSGEFEPKLGLVPLLFGTLKGTLYAMLFSVPIAILAALYVSQLAPAGLRTVVKPTVELMAALPSVVVGFLAALWLAPLLEGHLVDTLGALLAAPVGFCVALGAWQLVPRTRRQRARPGSEIAFLLPFLLVALWIGASLGGMLETRAFAGDARQWLFEVLGVGYDQRNCIVVGIALGFAVIPILFTIAEDALSAVPRTLTSGALALGASRWQSALHVVMPAASPGIFAAVMLGLGRAIGETMIVLMATGNTPIIDLSPFNGMRTMSAAIAVEIPEAPHGGTLYRVLFLTGLLLFAFTFLFNTAADVVGRRLRKRYGQF